MNIRIGGVIAPFASALSVFLAFSGLFFWAISVIPKPELSHQPWLRAAAVFIGAIAMIPAASTSLVLRVQRIDPAFVQNATGGIHPATYIAFCMGRGTLAKLLWLGRAIANNSTYPASIRYGANGMVAFGELSLAGLLVCVAALVLERASA